MAEITDAFLPRRSRALVGGQLWLLNILLCAVLCGEYLKAAEPPSFRSWLFLQSGRISCAATLSLLPGALLLAAGLLVRGRRTLAVLSGAVWSLGLFLLFVDTRIYGIFRYHFNGLVWNVLRTPGADEAVSISTRELVTVLGAFAALIPVQVVVYLKLWSRARSEKRVPFYARPRLVWGLLLAPSMLLAAGLYAHADLVRDSRVTAFARVYPVYPHFTIKRFAERHLGARMKDRPGVDLSHRGILLDYPRRAPSLPEGGPAPNILVVVIDSARADMLSPDVMPRTTELAARGRVFRDHLSTGNATRFGIFGLIYGLHGTYWKPVLQEHRSPVLIDALLERGYEMRVLTSASMDFPEFRSTAWVRIEGSVEDRLPTARPGGRDDGVARRFEEWLDGRAEPRRPFLAFLLLDAPHGRYSFPAEEEFFRPCAPDVNFSSVADGLSEEEVRKVFNRYRNAVRYADGIAGRALDALASRRLLEETLVVVTGDHGEEFLENGFWGHTSNYTIEQVRVPFVLAGPGVPPGEETRPTSHLDLAATLLESLGADPALRKDWTLGENLLDPPEGRVRIVSGWDTLGMHAPSGILEVPMGSHRGTEIAIYDRHWRRILDDEDGILQREGRPLGALALECRRFLR